MEVSISQTVLSQTWYPMTVATVSRIQKQIIYRYLDETEGSVDTVSVKVSNFKKKKLIYILLLLLL